MSETILLADWVSALVEQVLCLNLGSFCNKDNGRDTFPHVDLSAEEMSENELLKDGGQLMDMLCMRLLHDSSLRQGKAVLPYFLASFGRALDLTSKSQPFSVMASMRASQATDKDIGTVASNIRKALVTYSTLAVLEPDTFGLEGELLHARPAVLQDGKGEGVMLSEAHAALYDAMMAAPGSAGALHSSYIPCVIEHVRSQPGSVSLLKAFCVPLLRALAATSSHPLPVLDGPVEQHRQGAHGSDSEYRVPHRLARAEQQRWARDRLYTACGRPPPPPHAPAERAEEALGKLTAVGPSLLHPNGVKSKPTGPAVYAWEPALRWLCELARYPELAQLMVSEPSLWCTGTGTGTGAGGLLAAPQPAGDVMEGGTLLGRLFGLGPSPHDFLVPVAPHASPGPGPSPGPAATAHVDLLQAHAYWSTGVEAKAAQDSAGELKGASYLCSS